MPIYEFYCPDNNTIYQFFAKSRAQAETTPRCPENPAFRMEKLVSTFAIGSGAKEAEHAPESASAPVEDDPRMDAALSELESQMESIDENDPKAMARMMRRMAEVTGERLDEQMEEVVRKLEEGQDPESVEAHVGDAFGGEPPGTESAAQPAPVREGSSRAGYRRRAAPTRDPKLYEY